MHGVRQYKGFASLAPATELDQAQVVEDHHKKLDYNCIGRLPRDTHAHKTDEHIASVNKRGKGSVLNKKAT